MSSGVLDARPVLGVSAMLLNTMVIPVMAIAIRYLTEAGASTTMRVPNSGQTTPEPTKLLR